LVNSTFSMACFSLNIPNFHSKNHNPDHHTRRRNSINWHIKNQSHKASHTHTLSIRYRPFHVTDNPTKIEKKLTTASTAPGGSLPTTRQFIHQYRKLAQLHVPSGGTWIAVRRFLEKSRKRAPDQNSNI